MKNSKHSSRNSGAMKKIALASVLTFSLATASVAAASLALAETDTVLAANRGGMMNQGMMNQGMMNQGMGQQNVALADAAGEIVTSAVENTAAALTADRASATVLTVSDGNSQIKITEPGTYVITGSCGDGSVTVKKGTTGVVLILEDLDLTSTSGAPISVNKESEVQIVVSGSVTLTDAENPADETSADTAVAEAYDGAALKIKAGAKVYLTGSGTLTVNGTAKNGIKAGDTDSSLVVDGEGLTLNITAANDGINSGADLAILSGTVNIAARDDALHADRILTVGAEGSETGPAITVSQSSEGLEGTVVNIFSGSVAVVSQDDAINGTQTDAALTASINITGGSVTVQSSGDGLDCNGNINLLGGQVTISSASFGGEAGIDYDGQLYIADAAVLNNVSGISGPDGMGGMRGGMGGWGRMGQQTIDGTGTNGRPFDQRGQRGQQGQTVSPDSQQNTDTDSSATQTQPGQTPRNGFGGRGGRPDMNGQPMFNGPMGGQPMPPNGVPTTNFQPIPTDNSTLPSGLGF